VWCCWNIGAILQGSGGARETEPEGGQTPGDNRVWSKNLCGLAVVVLQQSTEPFLAVYELFRRLVCVG
jgi:hypothetical protein